MMLKAVDGWKTQWFFDVKRIEHLGIMNYDSLDNHTYHDFYYKNLNSNQLWNIDDFVRVGLGDNHCPRDFGWDVVQQYLVINNDDSRLNLAVFVRGSRPNGGFYLVDDNGNTASKLTQRPSSEDILSYQFEYEEELGIVIMTNEDGTVQYARKKDDEDYNGVVASVPYEDVDFGKVNDGHKLALDGIPEPAWYSEAENDVDCDGGPQTANVTNDPNPNRPKVVVKDNPPNDTDLIWERLDTRRGVPGAPESKSNTTDPRTGLENRSSSWGRIGEAGEPGGTFY